MAVSVPPAPAGAVPPQNLEAEVSVLGSILLTEQALDRVVVEVGLRPDDFYRPRNALVFRSMLRLKEKAEPEAVDALTVCDDLRRNGELEEAGGEAYGGLVRLTRILLGVVFVDFLAGALASASIKRVLNRRAKGFEHQKGCPARGTPFS